MSETVLSRRFRLRSPAPGVKAWFNDKFSVPMPLDKWRGSLAPGHLVSALVEDGEGVLRSVNCQVADVATAFHHEPLVVLHIRGDDGATVERAVPVHRVYPPAKSEAKA